MLPEVLRHAGARRAPPRLQRVGRARRRRGALRARGQRCDDQQRLVLCAARRRAAGRAGRRARRAQGTVWFGLVFLCFALLCFALRRTSDGAVVVPRTVLRMCALHGGCSAVTWRLLLRMCALFPPNTPNGRESHARARRGGCDVACGVARDGCDGCDGTRMRRSSTARTTRPAGTTGARATSSGRGGRPTRRPRGSSSGATV